MKKIISLILISLVLISLVSCGNKYEPVPSTEEEARVMLEMSDSVSRYSIKYELYRTFFLNYKSEIDGGDESVWSGEDKDEYIRRINELIVDRITAIYATLSLASSLGINPYSAEFEDKIAETVRVGVEGNEADITGHGGDYQAYLNSLKEVNMNYAVSELLIRYDLTLQALNEYYHGVVDPVLGALNGEFETTEEAVRDYYDGDECVRVLNLYFPAGFRTKEELLTMKAAMESKNNSMEVGLYIIQNSTALGSDIIDAERNIVGLTIGKYALDSLYYSEYTDAVFAMDELTVSDIITTDGENAGSYIVYKLEKTDDYFEDHYEVIKTSYIDNAMGKRIEQLRSELAESIDYTDAYEALSHKDISMN